MYPALLHLDAGLAGTGTAFDTWPGLLADPAQARTFTEAQHAGSLGAARVLAARLDLADLDLHGLGVPDGDLLDVGGGSGAFSVAFCERNPGLRATVLDLPAVVDVAREYRAATGLTGRVSLLAADAVTGAWPPDQHVVLMSYLLSALGDGEIDAVLAKARACLRPGGLLVVHDFMLDDHRPGPAPAALWFLQYVACRTDSVSFSGVALADRVRGHGIEPGAAEELIPEITKVIVARKLVSS